MFGEADWSAFTITLRLALTTTIILLIVGTPIAWWLARTNAKFKPAIEAIVALPLVLPPTVLGFYLLMALGSNGFIGNFMEMLGGQPLAFTFTGLVIGSLIYSFPFVVQPLKDAFINIGRTPLEVASTLRAGPVDRFFSVVLPLARPGFITAATLGFAHTLGEFGVVLMIGGNIPGETRVMSIAIFDYVESQNYAQANALALTLFVISFAMLLTVFFINRRFKVPKP
jgi:molybdate transport system permease protein